MKWLLLMILIISCGKHNSPSAEDLTDTDGDQISNADEERIGSNKYIADVQAIEELKGTININGSEYNFSNRKDLQQDTHNLLTRREGYLKTEEYFSEFSRLRFMKGGFPKITSDITDVSINFQSKHSPGTEIYFVTKNNQRKIQAWSLNVRLALTRTEIKELLEETAFMAVRKENPVLLDRDISQVDSILANTYRIFYSDKEYSKVFYVSKSYSFEAFKDFMGAKDSSVPDTGPMLYPLDNTFTDQWYERQLPNGDFVLALTDLKSLQKSYLKGFKKHEDEVYRKNGVDTKTIHLGKKNESRVVLKLRARKTIREFTEWVDTKKYYKSGSNGFMSTLR